MNKLKYEIFSMSGYIIRMGLD